MASDREKARVPAPVQLIIGIKDALDLIPEYSGRSATEYVHFYRGCSNAKALLGSGHEKTLLRFIHLKLKGLAYAKYALSASLSPSLCDFLCSMRKDFCRDLFEKSFWENEIKNVHQKRREFLRDYGARMQNVLACAELILNDASSSFRSLAIDEFKKNVDTEWIQDYWKDPSDSFDGIVDAVLAAERWAKEQAEDNFIVDTDDEYWE